MGHECWRGCPCRGAGLWKQAQTWMPDRSEHEVNGGPQRTSGDVAGEPPTGTNTGWTVDVTATGPSRPAGQPAAIGRN